MSELPESCQASPTPTTPHPLKLSAPHAMDVEPHTPPDEAKKTVTYLVTGANRYTRRRSLTLPVREVS